MKQAYLVTRLDQSDNEPRVYLNEVVCKTEQLADDYIMDLMRSYIGLHKRWMGKIDSFQIQSTFREFEVMEIDIYEG